MLFSFHFCNLVFACFGRRKYYVIVCLFFILSCPSCLANGKHHKEINASKVKKKPKMKLPKYYVIVCLFFILSCPSCLANGKHCTENHATLVTKNQKRSYQSMRWAGHVSTTLLRSPQIFRPSYSLYKHQYKNHLGKEKCSLSFLRFSHIKVEFVTLKKLAFR